MQIRCGDHVYHAPTGKTWVVAYTEGDYVVWLGTPPGRGRVADCKIVWACSEVEHVSILMQCAKSRGKAGQLAKAALSARRRA